MQNYRLYYKKLPWYDPEQAFLALYGDKKYTFWLDNNQLGRRSLGEGGSPSNQYSYMGIANKRIKYSISNHTLSISKENKTQKLHQSILTYLIYQIPNTKYQIPNIPFNFAGGFVGYFGYEMKTECCVPPITYHLSTITSKLPDSYLFFVDKFLAFDHSQKCLYLAAISENKKEALRWFSQTESHLEGGRLKRSGTMPVRLWRNSFQVNSLTFTPARSRRQYLKDIRTCQKYLAAGDAYQICLTNQITTNIKTNWFALYQTLRHINPSPLSAYINFGDFALLSSSPEQFLQVDKKNWVTSKPMKGTIRRSGTREKDLRLAMRLGKSEKDYAENIMIVDLVRNDLGKVCEIGSIKVIRPLEVQTYATVHQLISTIKGKLRPGVTIVDLLKASFPGGSMTGAPKTAACEIIAGLEKTPRGIYSGTFGFLSLNGAANLAMTIRTIIAAKDNLSFGTGGAILSDSIPKEEYSEMLLKAQPLITSIVKTTGAKTFRLSS